MMPDTTYEQLMSLPNGARFYRVDLRNHTPADTCFHCSDFSLQSVEALRQAFVDFDSRVRLEGEYREEHYPRLLGLSVEGGFLSGRPEKAPDGHTYRPFMVRFNPNMNTIIGGRGAGKSALLEAIRYAFDAPIRTEETQAQANKIVQFTLPAGARVTVYYELADGTRYRITRFKGGDPEVYDLATGDRKNVAPAALAPTGVPLEVYGQKEIFEISKDVQFQLNLLDTYIADALRGIQREEGELLRWLSANAQDILRLQEESAQASQRLQELEAVRLELERMERQEAVSRLERKKHLEREKALLDRAVGAVNERVKALERFQSGQDPLRDNLPAEANLKAEKLPHAGWIMAQAALLARIDDAFDASMEALRQGINDIWAAGRPARETWQAAYLAVQKEYEALVRELGQDFSAERYFALQAKLQTLEAIYREVQRRDQRLQELSQEREKRLWMLRRLRLTREFRLRRDKARQLTDHLQDTVRITLECEGNRRAYGEKLAELLAGRRIRKDVFEKLAMARFPRLSGDRGAYTHPKHLVYAIRQERQKPSDDCSLLATIYGISKAYRERLAAVDDQTLYDLETYRVPDLPDISLKVGTQHRSLTPPEGKPGLSTGQKCTAILSIILLERDAPLVIDQPEDDLDNEFIFRQIVQTLRREKERRQFIIVTHNANIPVAGDAELIAVMQADDRHGWIERAGSIDDPGIREPVENILEGGHAAFQIRQMKYEILE